MKRLRFHIILITLIGILAAAAAVCAQGNTPARPFLCPLFTDNMVLQRDARVPVWGWTTPGVEVKVELNGKSARAVADAQGKWVARIGKFAAGGPYTVTISGPQNVTLKNVMIGDVWLCSGQSNMEMGIQVAKNSTTEIAGATNPNIRLFTVKKVLSPTPLDTVEGKWDECTPSTVISQGTWGGFSAAAYFFGRGLQKDLGIPIGLIQSAWGGTYAEAWTGRRSLAKIPEMKYSLDRLQQNVDDRKLPNYNFAREFEKWWEQTDPSKVLGGPRWSDPSLDESAWTTATLPPSWSWSPLLTPGVIWFRKSFDVPADWSGKEADLHLGMIMEVDTTWLNGQKIGATDYWGLPRDYHIPAGLLHPGKNVLAFGDFKTSSGGFGFDPNELYVNLTADPKNKVSLAGEWKYRIYKSPEQLTPAPQDLENSPNAPTQLYNAMIAPLDHFAIKGVIWYQGEANADRPEAYRIVLPTLIEDWRSQFGEGKFPFLIVQLANYLDWTPEPTDYTWPEVREAQALTVKNVPNTGLAVAIDVGEAKDIHPKNKQEVGRRLELAALAIAYKQKVEYSGPVYESMKVDGKAIRISFTHVDGGLTLKGGDKLTGFIICGADKKFVWADAAIDGDTVVVSSPKVDKPVAVRYGWKMNPACNLYNKADLPAGPFRTDGP
jgi:sialate O-acetylesterase